MNGLVCRDFPRRLSSQAFRCADGRTSLTFSLLPRSRQSWGFVFSVLHRVCLSGWPPSASPPRQTFAGSSPSPAFRVPSRCSVVVLWEHILGFSRRTPSFGFCVTETCNKVSCVCGYLGWAGSRLLSFIRSAGVVLVVSVTMLWGQRVKSRPWAPLSD